MDSRTRRDLELLVLNAVSIRAFERLLFIECGDGWIVEEAWRRARRGYAGGVDASPALVARADALLGVPGALEFKTWDRRHIPWPARFFHRVISTVALHRSADSARLLPEMHRVLRLGGHLYLTELDHAQQRPVKVASPTLEPELQRAGFEAARELTRCDIGQDTNDPASVVVMVARCALRGPRIHALGNRASDAQPQKIV